MRLGVRWNSREVPHPSVPEPLHSAIHAQEAEHRDAEAWTLTWHEGRAHCRLDALVLVAEQPDGSVSVTSLVGDALSADDDDDDWLT